MRPRFNLAGKRSQHNKAQIDRLATKRRMDSGVLCVRYHYDFPGAATKAQSPATSQSEKAKAQSETGESAKGETKHEGETVG